MRMTIFTAVRLGMSLYGLNPSGSVLDLPLWKSSQPWSLVSELVHVKQLEVQDIGYGQPIRRKNPTGLETIPIGYAGWLDPRDAKLSCVD